MKPTPEMIEAAAKEFARKIDEDDHTGGWHEIDEYSRDFYREAALFALQAALQAIWQPIESAPKDEDGPNLWGWSEKEGDTYLMYWDGSGWEDWGALHSDLVMGLPRTPTHFIDPGIFPLPTPPEGT